MLLSKLKKLFHTLSISSTCCNNFEDEEWMEYLLRRVENLEKEYDKCIEHQRQLRREIQVLLSQLEPFQVPSELVKPLLDHPAHKSLPGSSSTFPPLVDK